MNVRVEVVLLVLGVVAVTIAGFALYPQMERACAAPDAPCGDTAWACDPGAICSHESLGPELAIAGLAGILASLAGLIYLYVHAPREEERP